MTDSRRLPPDAIVDAHHHLWHRSQRPQPWIDPKTMAAIDRDFDVADLASAARAAGVAQTVLVQSTASTAETIDLLDIAADSNLIGGVVGWVDLSAENVAERLDQLQTAPGGDQLVGIRHTVQDEPDPALLDRTDIRRGIAAVRDAGLVFDLLIRDHQLPAAARLVRDLPSVAFVLDHLAKPALAHGELDGWARNLSSLARLPTSRRSCPGWLPRRLGRRGSPRIFALPCFTRSSRSGRNDSCSAPTGRSACWRPPTNAGFDTLAELLSDLSETDRAMIWTRTARRVYRLRPAWQPEGLARTTGTPQR